MKLSLKHRPKLPDNQLRKPIRRTPPIDRTRTFTQTFSYHASRAQTELNTGRETWSDKPGHRTVPSQLQRIRMHWHWAWLAGGALLIAGVVLQLQLSNIPKVVSLIPASDAPFLQDSVVYQQAATKLIESSVVNRNKLTINTLGIADTLKQQFPELQSVTVTLPLLGDAPIIYLRPADPALILVTANKSFIVDKRGRALAEVQSQAQLMRLRLPTVTDQSNLSFKYGDQALSRQTTAFIQTIARQHAAQKAEIQAMTLPSAASELDVYLTGKSYFIKYNLQHADEQSANLQAGSYAAVTRHLTTKDIVPSHYVDMRLQGRAYYK